jgi:aldehyde:ferredoxin oxidoreductase
MLGGYAGRMLFIDLAEMKFQEEALDERLALEYIGGYGVGARVLYERQRPGADPLGPDNMLGILTGPLTGTLAQTGTRWTVVGKSPLTGTWGDANGSGHFGPALKFAGYDALFFTGIAHRPVYLTIENGRAELRDADDWWGLDSYALEDRVKSEFGEEAEAVCIGPAGEKLSLISGVVHSKGRIAGRSGLGAVMGSKRLKMIVVRGHAPIPVADPVRVKELQKKYALEIAKEKVGFADSYRSTGTPGYIETGAANGDSPTRNWGGVGLRDFQDPEPIGYEAIVAAGKARKACWRCPIACWGELEVPYDGGKSHAHVPEYETASAFGSNCLVNDLSALVRANELCNRYGLDTISTGATIAFAMECYEQGIISAEDTGGIELRWGDAEAMIAILERVCQREGLGDVLADGVKRAAEHLGRDAQTYAIHVHGQELPMHDPRFEPGLGVIYKIDATPGRHTQASQFIPPPEFDIGVPDFGTLREQQNGRGRYLKPLSALNHVMNTSGMCLFGYLSTRVKFLPDWLSAVTGHEYTLEELLLVGERIANIRQAFNIREGVNLVAAPIPERAYGRPPLTAGPTAGISVDVETMLREHLEEMGWTQDEARPTAQKLKELGLDDVARDLWATSS